VVETGLVRRTAVLLLVALVLASCEDGDPSAERPAVSTTSTTTTTTAAPDDGSTTTASPPPLPDPAALETVVTGLEVPWDVAFVDADTLFVTEREGRVRLVDAGRLREAPVAEPEVDATGEGGLLGIALHPDFPAERWAYLYATTAGGNQVSRWRVGDDLTFSDPEVLIDRIPAARNHDGGRIAFGPDRMLYVGTGDARQPERAADLGSLAGKILRVTADGQVPDDNPSPGSPVWTYGHRNVQGLAWDASGRMWASEHGPSGEFGLCCNDEINRIRPASFYGWPFATAEGPTGAGDVPAGSVSPTATSGSSDTWAPSGIAVLGDSLLVTTLRGKRLLRFPIAGDDTVGDPEVVRDDLGRLRIAAVAPDGCLWIGTSNRDGRGDPADGDDRLLRAC
jgi:glucose/arabinose dehydrogenase